MYNLRCIVCLLVPSVFRAAFRGKGLELGILYFESTKVGSVTRILVIKIQQFYCIYSTLKFGTGHNFPFGKDHGLVAETALHIHIPNFPP